MPDITKIKIGNERERSYKDFPANREFKKRAEDENPSGGWPAYLPVPASEGYGHFVYITQSVSFASDPLPWDGLCGGIPVARGKLTIGDTYLVGTAQGNVECVCFDNDGFPTIGKSDDDMQETGDWQICEDSGEIYCGVVGLKNDVFNFTIYNLPLAVPVKIDEEFLPDPAASDTAANIMFVLDFEESVYKLSADMTDIAAANKFVDMCKYNLSEGMGWSDYKWFAERFNVYAVVISSGNKPCHALVPLSFNFNEARGNTYVTFAGNVAYTYGEGTTPARVSFNYNPNSGTFGAVVDGIIT